MTTPIVTETTTYTAADRDDFFPVEMARVEGREGSAPSSARRPDTAPARRGT